MKYVYHDVVLTFTLIAMFKIQAIQLWYRITRFDVRQTFSTYYFSWQEKQPGCQYPHFMRYSKRIFHYIYSVYTNGF